MCSALIALEMFLIKVELLLTILKESTSTADKTHNEKALEIRKEEVKQTQSVFHFIPLLFFVQLGNFLRVALFRFNLKSVAQFLVYSEKQKNPQIPHSLQPQCFFSAEPISF